MRGRAVFIVMTFAAMAFAQPTPIRPKLAGSKLIQDLEPVTPKAGMVVRFQASTPGELKKLSNPRAFFNDRDFFWTDRDADKKLCIRLNRAFLTQVTKTKTEWCLFDTVAPLADDAVGSGYLYGSVSAAPYKVLLRDPERGVVYQMLWQSEMLPGTGHWTGTRDLYFLCDAQSRWHFLAEGPGFDTGRTGPADHYAGQVQAKAEFALDKVEPVKLTLTQVREYFCPSDSPVDTVPPPLQVRTDLTPAQAGRELSAEETYLTEEGVRLRRLGPDYILIEKPESLSSLKERVAHWRAGTLDTTKLPAQLPAGTKVLIAKN